MHCLTSSQVQEQEGALQMQHYLGYKGSKTWTKVLVVISSQPAVSVCLQPNCESSICMHYSSDTSYHIGADVLNAQIQILKLEQEFFNINKATWLVLPYFLMEDIKNED